MAKKDNTKEAMSVDEVIKESVKIIRKYFGQKVKIYLFGSWAKGNAQWVSDIDLAVYAEDQQKGNTFSLIRNETDKLRTIRKIDIIDLSVTTEKFRKHIFKYAIAL